MDHRMAEEEQRGSAAPAGRAMPTVVSVQQVEQVVDLVTAGVVAPESQQKLALGLVAQRRRAPSQVCPNPRAAERKLCENLAGPSD